MFYIIPTIHTLISYSLSIKQYAGCNIMFLRPLLHRFSVFQSHYLPTLDYAYDALEPVISRQQLQLHHKKHHQAYVNNLNNIINKLPEMEQLEKTDPDSDMFTLLKNAQFNLGGHINHSIYWKNLSPINRGGGKLPDENSPFAQQVKQQFGSFDKLIEELSKRTIVIQGSGWGWLAFDNKSRLLRILQLPNQQTLPTQDLVALLTIDVWEHAYYVDYKNIRAEYVKNIWRIVNWKEVQNRYNQALRAF